MTDLCQGCKRYLSIAACISGARKLIDLDGRYWPALDAVISCAIVFAGRIPRCADTM